jgi:uncharacterized protein (TIGR00369 family)
MSQDPKAILRMMEEQVPFNRLLGIRGDAARVGWARLVLDVGPQHVGDPLRPAVHGGVLSALIDTAGGVAAWSALSAGHIVSTVDLRVDYLEPARPEGTLVAEAELVRKGNRVCHVRVSVRQEGTLVAEGRAVFSIHDAHGPAKGRPRTS